MGRGGLVRPVSCSRSRQAENFAKLKVLAQWRGRAHLPMAAAFGRQLHSPYMSSLAQHEIQGFSKNKCTMDDRHVGIWPKCYGVPRREGMGGPAAYLPFIRMIMGCCSCNFKMGSYAVFFGGGVTSNGN